MHWVHVEGGVGGGSTLLCDCLFGFIVNDFPECFTRVRRSRGQQYSRNCEIKLICLAESRLSSSCSLSQDYFFEPQPVVYHEYDTDTTPS